jgi:signal-transduction protein with cAMP-binding, CBS, and nucleotidyltransferase domain
MNYVKSFRETDLEKLGQLKIFSWLSPSEVKTLGSSLKVQIFQRNEVIFRESTVATGAHVLVSGIARVTKPTESLSAHHLAVTGDPKPDRAAGQAHLIEKTELI